MTRRRGRFGQRLAPLDLLPGLLKRLSQLGRPRRLIIGHVLGDHDLGVKSTAFVVPEGLNEVGPRHGEDLIAVEALGLLHDAFAKRFGLEPVLHLVRRRRLRDENVRRRHDLDLFVHVLVLVEHVTQFRHDRARRRPHRVRRLRRRLSSHFLCNWSLH